MEQLTIMKPGLLTTVQDLGRPDYRKYGVSVSGVMDSFSTRVGNILLGNNEREAVLEVTLIGPSIKFDRDTLFVITGGDLSPELNKENIMMWKVIQANAGDVLSFGKCRIGCRAYIAFAGGIDVPEVMKSKATFLRGEYGGFHGRALKRGDQLILGQYNIPLNKIKGRRLRPIDIPDFMKNDAVRIIEGPHLNEFEERSVKEFFASQYTLSNASDRMGYRLEGPTLQHKNAADIISDFITRGTIQVPGNGQPIIHMADCGASGGYTKLGVVIDVDLSILAQKKPGDTLAFRIVTIEEAQQEITKQEKYLFELKLNNRGFI